MKKIHRVLLVLAAAVVILSLAAMSLNLGTDTVRDIVSEAVTEKLDSRITIGSVKGNPFKGYRMENISLSTDNEEVFTAERITAKVSILSFLTGGPPVSVLEISGFNSDVERINRLISKIETGDEAGELPLRKIRVVESNFSTPWAAVVIKEVTLALDGNLIGSYLDVIIDELPVKGDLDVSIAEGASAIRKMDLAIGQGRITASGEVVPELSVRGKVREIDIAKLVGFWPDANPELYKGSLSSDFSAQKTWQQPEISGNMDFKGNLISGIPVEKATARWRFFNNRLDVADLDVFTLGFPLKGDLAFVFDPKSPPRMRIDLKGSAADLEALSQVSAKLKGMKGTMDNFSILLEGQVSNPEGQINFEARKLGFREYSASDTSISARVRGGDVSISGKSAFEGAPLTLGGTVSNFMRDPVASLQGTLRSLSLESLKKLAPAMKEMDLKGRVNSDYKVSGPVHTLTVSGKAWSDSMTLGEYALSNPSTFFDYDIKGDTLSFTEMQAGWKQAAISGRGKISALSSESREGDIVVQAANLDSAFFSSFYPPISEYRLKGDMSVEAQVKGILSSPSVTVSLVSRALSLMDNYSFANLKAGTRITGLKNGIPSDLDLNISADSASIAGATLQALKVELEKKAKVITVKQGSASMGAGTLSAGGNVTMEDPVEKTTLNLALKAENIDLDRISLSDGKKLPLAGILTGDVTVTGKVEKPQVSVNATAPFIAAAGLKADSVKIRISGDTDNLRIEDLSGKVGDGSIAVKGDVRPAPFAADISVNGKSLELNPLLSRFEKLEPLNITGKSDLAFNGQFSEKGNSGTGKATSSSVRVMGMEITNITLPLELDGSRLTSPDGTGRLYGGQIMNDFALNLAGMTFFNEIDVKDADLNALLKDAYKLEGSITGKAELFAKINGTFGDELKYTGKGLLKTGQGMISGFKIIDLVAAIHKTRGLQYASIYAPFDLQTGKLILSSETLVKAPDGDPLYQFLTASGGVGPDNRLNLACNGKLNIKVINALLGGATGGLGGFASTQNLAGILQGVIEGTGTSLRDDDFRDVSFNVGGTFEKPGISNVKISPSEKQEAADTAPSEEKTLQEKVLEQIIPGAAPTLPQQQIKEESTKPEQTIQQKVLEQLIPGAKPEPKQAPEQPAVKTETAPAQQSEPVIKPVQVTTTQPEATIEPEPKPEPELKPEPETKPEPKPEPETKPEPEAESTIEVKQEPAKAPTPEPGTSEGHVEEQAPKPEEKPATQAREETPQEQKDPADEAPEIKPEPIPPVTVPTKVLPQEVVSEDVSE